MALAGPSLCPDNFRQKRFRSLISMKDVVFATFFIIDDKLKCDGRASRPLWVGGILTVTE